MTLWVQHLLALAVVAAATVVVVRQAVASLRGRKSKLGSCCDRGCAAATPAKSTAERIVFLPVEMLTRRRR